MAILLIIRLMDKKVTTKVKLRWILTLVFKKSRGNNVPGKRSITFYFAGTAAFNRLFLWCWCRGRGSRTVRSKKQQAERTYCKKQQQYGGTFYHVVVVKRK
jgi:hypothetical protein